MWKEDIADLSDPCRDFESHETIYFFLVFFFNSSKSRPHIERLSQIFSMMI